MRKKEFSKIILIVSYLTAITFTFLGAYLVFMDKDISSFANIVLSSWIELASATSFYYWKAKNENMLKLGILNKGDIQNEN